ncbi:MAG: hypothetical protein ACU0BF_08215 [Paracoccaceae bacterium]
MSWSRRAVLTLPLGAAACGFTPVLGPVGGPLAGATVATPPGADGQALRWLIEDRLGAPVQGGPVLSITDLAIVEDPVGITPGQVATRYTLLGRADWAMGAATGTVRDFAGYSATDTPVTRLAARRDARTRVLTLLADALIADARLALG